MTTASPGPNPLASAGGSGLASESQDPDATELVILTGMSGAGRSTAANVLEDIGWYVVDNLPPQLILPMATLAAQATDGGVTKVAAVIDEHSMLETSSSAWTVTDPGIYQVRRPLARMGEALREPRVFDFLQDSRFVELSPEVWRLALDAATRETLLQILNDIRVGCWHALGEPETLDVFTPKTVAEISLQNWMDLAGFFEQSLIELE